MNYENYLLTLDKIIPLYYEDVQCSLANGCCDKFCDDNLLMDALKEATFIPLPTHGH